MKVLKRPMFKYGGDVKKQGIMHKMNGLRNGGVATTMADATGMANGGIMRQGYQDGSIVNFFKQNVLGPRFTDPNYQPKMNLQSGSGFNFMSPKNQLFYGPEALKLQKTKLDNINKQKLIDMGVKGIELEQEQSLTPLEEARKFKKKQEAAIAKDIIKEPVGMKESIFSTEELQSPALAKRVDKQYDKYLAEKNKNNTGTKTVKKTNDEKDAERLERAYKIMGVDDAKKDAVYNALINLSQGQGIDTKDISGSINRAIGALSKTTDKVTDLKDKAKAAVASGTLQAEFAKEIADAKGTPLTQAEKTYLDSGFSANEARRKTLKLPITYEEAQAMAPRNITGSKNLHTFALKTLFDGRIGQPKYQTKLFDVELEDITVGEKLPADSNYADGVYEVEKGYIIVEDGVIKSKKNLRPKKK